MNNDLNKTDFDGDTDDEKSEDEEGLRDRDDDEPTGTRAPLSGSSSNNDPLPN